MADQFKLDFSTLVDGNSSQWEQVRDIAVDKQGNTYITGGTTATSGFPITSGNDYKSYGGNSSQGSYADTDVFVMKYDPSGKLLWSTRLGGKNYDRAYAIEIDDKGSVYVAGRAGEGLKTTNGSYQTNFGGDTSSTRNAGYGDQDGFVAKLSASSGDLNWATYVGGADGGFIRDIDVDSTGTVHIAQANVKLSSGQAVTSNAMDKTFDGTADIVYSQISSDGKSLLYGTYIDGSGSAANGSNPSIIVDNKGDINIGFFAGGRGLPITSGAIQSSAKGGTDAYVIKLDGATGGKTIKSATFFGSSSNEDMETHQLAIDNQGNFLISGRTFGNNLTTNGSSFQSRAAGNADGFIAKISADGKTLLASTYFGGNGKDEIEGIVITNDGVYITGTTESSNLPVTDKNIFGGDKAGSDGFIAKFSLDLSTLEFASYIGGSGADQARAIAVATDGDIIIGGQTTSTNFDLHNAADGSKNGTYAGFLTRISEKEVVTQPPNTNSADINLTVGIVETGEFGNKYNAESAPDGSITASFENSGEDVQLSLRGYDIDFADEVDVLLNGTVIGSLAKGINNAESAARDVFVISSAEQISGTNIVTFQQAINNTYRWGVTDVLIDEVSSQPPNTNSADINLTVGIVETGEFGNKYNAESAPDGSITASFENSGEDVQLSLRGYDIDFADEVDVLLNGTVIGSLAKGINNAESAARDVFVISSAEQISGTNIVTFQQAINNTYRWGVTDVLIDEVSSQPPNTNSADINLTVGIVETGEFGNRFEGLTDNDGLITASFTGDGSDLVLRFNAYDMDFSNEMEILLNGVSVGFANKGINNSFSAQDDAFFLAKEDQVNGENILTFKQALNNSYVWGVKDISIKDVGESPLVLDLDGDGVELLSVNNGVQFDIDNDGQLEQTAWVAADDGLLALDENNDGIINDRSELFGNTNDYTDGFDNLSSYDNNSDGVINNQDSVYDSLKVWQDVNSDGVSQSHEMFSLLDVGVVGIFLNATMPDDLVIEGSWISHVGSYITNNGQEHDVIDAWFNSFEDSGQTMMSLENAEIDIAEIFETQDDITMAIQDFVYSENNTNTDQVKNTGQNLNLVTDIVMDDLPLVVSDQIIIL